MITLQARLSCRRCTILVLICCGLIPLHAVTTEALKVQPAPVTVSLSDMTFTGDVVVGSASAGRCNAVSIPLGAIAIGADADHCDPASWKGGTATASVTLQDLFSPTVYALRINMDDSACFSEGVIDQNRYVSILLDGQEVCRVRVGMSEIPAGYWVPIHSSFVTSIVVRQSKSYELGFRVPPEAMWIIRKLELVPYPYPELVRGIGYSPYRDCQYPGSVWAPCIPTEQEIREDMLILSHTCNAIRTYGASGINSMIPRIASEYGLRVFAGAWIDTSDEKNHQEIEALIEIANSCDIDGVIIGNEYLLRREIETGWGPGHDSIMDQKASYLANFIRTAKAGIHRDHVKIIVAETMGQVYDSTTNSVRKFFQKVLDELDMVMVHVYPFWSYSEISGAAKQATLGFEEVRDLLRAQNKRVIIGETGWPSAGERHSGSSAPEAAASMTSQRQYLTEFLSLAEDRGVEYMYFDAFDELWKIEEGTVGQNWGYCFSDRSNKHDFSGVLLPKEEYVAHRGRSIVESDLRDDDQASHRFVVYDEWPPILRRDSAPDDLSEHFKDTTSKESKSASHPQWNIFIPSGLVGNYDAISLKQCDRTDPQSGKMAVRIDIDFVGCPSWAGVQWLANEQWTGPGIDIYKLLSVPRQSKVSLKFWAKGLRGNERVKFGRGGNKGSLGKDEDDWITLDTTWMPHSFLFSAKDDLSDVIGGLSVVTDLIHNHGRAITIFLDNIYFEAAQ